MNQLFEKIKESIVADFNEVTAVREKQDPIAQLNKYLRESEREVEKAAKLVERQRILKNEFYKELLAAQSLTEKRKQQGKLAMDAGAEDLANMALQYQAQAERQVGRLQQSFETATDQLQELEQKYEEMKLKVKDMHFKRMELMGRENVLSMKERMNKLLDETEFGSTAENIDHIETSMKKKETDANDEYDITIFDAKIKQLAKEMSNEEKPTDENVIQ